jgi:aspartate aminotransferase-like enzyme
MPKVSFKEAVSTDELQQVHALNHRVFAEEIAQHHTHPSGLLIDRFHDSNRYFIAIGDGRVMGMISANSGPKFSITKRLPDAIVLEHFLRPLELRLLAILPQERNRTILAGLLWQAYDFAVSEGFSHLLISAIVEKESMYRKLGFNPLGPAVSEAAVSFLPMVMAIDEQAETQRRRVQLHERRWHRGVGRSGPISLMPGPVCIHPRVARAFASPPVSHRSLAFIDTYEEVRLHLNRLLGGMEVAIFPGGGTLANDAIAANLKAIFGDAEGLVLTNGEFGERLANQAARADIKFNQLQFSWGGSWSFPAIEDAFNRKPAWLWAAHLETSTGVLNDIQTLLELAESASCVVALDCVSSLGASPIADSRHRLFLASGVSGKSLGSYAGLSFVYLSEECRERLANKLLRPSFDLLRMHQTRGPIATVPSSLVLALDRALRDNYGSLDAIASRYQEYQLLGKQTRHEMRIAGLEPIAMDTIAAPNITTFVLPHPSFAKTCLEIGYQIAHESPYLHSRGWGQIATMGNITLQTLAPLFCIFRSKSIHVGLSAGESY